MIEKNIYAPFGISARRFLNLGYHPGLEVRSETANNSELFPGCYDFDKTRRIVSKVPRWKNQEETEEFSRRMGYIGDDIIKRRLWLKSIAGPGWHDPKPPSLRSFTFPKAARFPVQKLKSYSVPGPGTYGKNHVPYTRAEEKSRWKGFSFSNIPSFEQSSNSPRNLNTELTYHLPPNLYKIKTSIDELLSKRISKRGPYDLFSGERFPDPVVTKLSLQPHRMHPSDLNHPKNAFKGKFLRCGKNSQLTSRLILMDLALSKKYFSQPGPNHYDPYPALPVTQSHAPFNSSVKHARPVIKCGISPPPGRYNPELKRRIIGDGMRSCFISKVKRGLPLPQKHSWFE